MGTRDRATSVSSFRAGPYEKQLKKISSPDQGRFIESLADKLRGYSEVHGREFGCNIEFRGGKHRVQFPLVIGDASSVLIEESENGTGIIHSHIPGGPSQDFPSTVDFMDVCKSTSGLRILVGPNTTIEQRFIDKQRQQTLQLAMERISNDSRRIAMKAARERQKIRPFQSFQEFDLFIMEKTDELRKKAVMPYFTPWWSENDVADFDKMVETYSWCGIELKVNGVSHYNPPEESIDDFRNSVHQFTNLATEKMNRLCDDWVSSF